LSVSVLTTWALTPRVNVKIIKRIVFFIVM
jgi:hypothetical protein